MSKKSMEEFRETLCHEFDEIARKKDLTAKDLELARALTETINNIDEIICRAEIRDYIKHGDFTGFEESGNSFANRGAHYVRAHYSRESGAQEYPSHMRDYVHDPYFEDHSERMRRSYPRNYRADETMSRNRRDYSRGNSYSDGKMQPMTHQIAEEWVDDMQNADGSRGGKWTMEEVKPLLTKKGIPEDKQCAYWAVMNSLYSDYSAVLKKLNASTADVYFELAKAFIDDPDAVPDKVEQYFEHIVKH